MGVILMDSFSSQQVSEAVWVDSGVNKGIWFASVDGAPAAGFNGADGYYKASSGAYTQRSAAPPAADEYRTVAFAIWPRSSEAQGPLPFWVEGSSYPSQSYCDFYVQLADDGSLDIRCGPGAPVIHTTPLNTVPMDAWSWISYTCQWSAAPYWSVSVNGAEVASSAVHGTASVLGESWNYITTATQDSSGSYYMDDFIATSDQATIPPTKVIDLVPASTATGEWTGSDGNSVDNHLLVSDYSDTATYVEAGSAGLTDLYGHGHTFTSDPMAIQVIGSMRYDGIGNNGMDLVLKSGTAESTLSAVPVDAWTSYLMEVQDVDPNTGAAWTAAAANALTFGVRST